ncbi:MAG: DUF2683 family protein [Candidatus Aenigmatarchaeota archaeon]
MVKAIIDIEEKANRVINIVKAKYGLKDKSQAINIIVKHFEECELEPELRPEFIKELRKSENEKTIKVKNFAKRYGLKR